jgi:integrase
MSLTEAAVRAAKPIPGSKQVKHFDERGLYLLVDCKTGAKLWRLKYRFGGQEKLLSLGAYPDVGLKRAREKRDETRRLIADGVDPSAKRRAESVARADTFAAIADEWLQTKKATLSPGTWQRDRDQLVKLVGPDLGKKPIATIEAPDLLAVLRKIEKRGRHDTAHRVRAVVGRVMRYAIATGRARHDISADLKGALAPKATQNYAAITEPTRVGELLHAIDGYVGQPTTRAMLRLAPLVFVRPGELRGAEWTEFDLDGAEWRIPAERMKMGEHHVVPLSRQAVKILRELHPVTGTGRYVFPALHTSLRCLSENTLNVALRRLGYSSEEMTAHGFRSTASTLLNEHGFHPDLIELQLAHAERNKVRAAYNRAQRLDERRRMMQVWADYLDGLRAGGKVVPFKRAARA